MDFKQLSKTVAIALSAVAIFALLTESLWSSLLVLIALISILISLFAVFSINEQSVENRSFKRRYNFRTTNSQRDSNFNKRLSILAREAEKAVQIANQLKADLKNI